jgi:hypothetical protein
VHEHDDRERAPSAFWQTEITDEGELTGLEGDLLDPGGLGLPRTGGEEQHDDQEEEGQLASLEGFDFVSNRLSVHFIFLYFYCTLGEATFASPRIKLCFSG